MMENDEKIRWKNLRNETYMDIVFGPLPQEESIERIKRYKGGLYESPKTFVDVYAINDGTWVKYVHNGILRVKNKKELGDYLYGYVCFLQKVGIADQCEMFYYCLCFLIDVLEYRKGLFGCSMENRRMICDKIENVRRKKPTKVVTAKKDDREFCMDPKVIQGMSVGEKTRLQKRIQKDIKDKRIAEIYDRGLSVRKNVEKCIDRGLDVSVGRLEQWIQEYIKG